MNYDSCDRPSSRVSRPPGGCSSNIFGDPTPVNAPVKTSRNPSYQSSVFATDTPAEPAIKPKPGAVNNNLVENDTNLPESVHIAKEVRRDPITGEIIDRDEKKLEDVETPAPAEGKENQQKAETNHEPHLGGVRNNSGVRCAQPPGGRSTFTLG
ncbi:uncharacterized protein LOC143462279 isoform X2 [Clavelina lepadiformis]|uniref:uncharacterized protein LOC143462279 isoform X2 n=1 Tax=Clavelina lepadiformis TaxID=159417 RepID=UPI00404368FF